MLNPTFSNHIQKAVKFDYVVPIEIKEATLQGKQDIKTRRNLWL